MRTAGKITAAALGAGNMAESRYPEITEDKIAETIVNWDCEAVGARVFIARILHEQSAHSIVLTDHAAEEQNDGVVISAGPLAVIADQRPKDAEEEEEWRFMAPDLRECHASRFLRPGDRITFGKWSGDYVYRNNTVKAGLRKLMVMNCDMLVGKPVKKGA